MNRQPGSQPGSPRGISLKTRVGLVLTALAAVFILILGAFWVHGTRASIHEEVEAATRVSAQWLQAVIGEVGELPPAARERRLIAVVRGIGRVRANGLEIRSVVGDQLLYASPPSAYKRGRTAPGWLAGLLTPAFVPATLETGDLRLILHPDPSRAVLDAWDELLAMAGWALSLLVALFLLVRRALARALAPLKPVMHALDRTGSGSFDTRLPVFATPELGRLALAFNGMADRLQSAVVENVRLETERELALHVQARLEAERREIARELHDELAQGITAVRALAGAIAQRTPDEPGVHGAAQSIIAVTTGVQDGVRGILHRLRPAESASLLERLNATLALWQARHAGIALEVHCELGGVLPDELLSQALLRIVQEGLTNVLRHAGASRVELRLTRVEGGLGLSLADNGGGCDGSPSPEAGSGLGLAGMRERVALLGGTLAIDSPAGGGFVLRAWLPVREEKVS